jgi:hypothetical protein
MSPVSGYGRFTLPLPMPSNAAEAGHKPGQMQSVKYKLREVKQC